MSESDPNVWSGRALQEVFVEVAVAVLLQCIRSLIGAVLLRTIMDISARAISLADRPQRAIRVTSVRMRREDRSSISSYSSRRPRRVRVFRSGYIICGLFILLGLSGRQRGGECPGRC